METPDVSAGGDAGTATEDGSSDTSTGDGGAAGPDACSFFCEDFENVGQLDDSSHPWTLNAGPHVDVVVDQTKPAHGDYSLHTTLEATQSPTEFGYGVLQRSFERSARRVTVDFSIAVRGNLGDSFQMLSVHLIPGGNDPGHLKVHVLVTAAGVFVQTQHLDQNGDGEGYTSIDTSSAVPLPNLNTFLRYRLEVDIDGEAVLSAGGKHTSAPIGDAGLGPAGAKLDFLTVGCEYGEKRSNSSEVWVDDISAN